MHESERWVGQWQRQRLGRITWREKEIPRTYMWTVRIHRHGLHRPCSWATHIRVRWHLPLAMSPRDRVSYMYTPNGTPTFACFAATVNQSCIASAAKHYAQTRETTQATRKTNNNYTKTTTSGRGRQTDQHNGRQTCASQRTTHKFRRPTPGALSPRENTWKSEPHTSPPPPPPPKLDHAELGAVPQAAGTHPSSFWKAFYINPPTESVDEINHTQRKPLNKRLSCTHAGRCRHNNRSNLLRPWPTCLERKWRQNHVTRRGDAVLRKTQLLWSNSPPPRPNYRCHKAADPAYPCKEGCANATLSHQNMHQHPNRSGSSRSPSPTEYGGPRQRENTDINNQGFGHTCSQWICRHSNQVVTKFDSN